MKKYLACSILASFGFAATSNAAVIVSLTGNPVSGPAFFVTAGSSTVVPDGSLVRLGTFDAAPEANADFATFASSFREFARTTMGNASNVNTGHIVRNNLTGGTGPESPDGDASFIGKTIYIWVYNSATDSASVEQGVFATTLAYADQATALATSLTTYVNAFGRSSAGAASVEKNAAQTAVTRFNLAPVVPEPSVTLSLGLLGALGLMRRRR